MFGFGSTYTTHYKELVEVLREIERHEASMEEPEAFYSSDRKNICGHMTSRYSDDNPNEVYLAAMEGHRDLFNDFERDGDHFKFSLRNKAYNYLFDPFKG